MFSLSKLLCVGEGRAIKRLDNIADQATTKEDEYAALSDDELRAKTEEFKKQLADGVDVGDLLLDAFTTAREASWYALGQKHFHVQVMGDAALHFDNVTEMDTGEDKTLTCVLPAYLNALAGKGVHVVTVNDYLAKRDTEWMGRVHHFLGLEASMILSELSPDQRRKVYAAGIICGTNNEFGFDYLRDSVAHSLDDLVQRGHHFAIVDGVGPVLIDEARTPLIISGPADGDPHWYLVFSRIVPRMKRDIHYEADERKHTIGIREEGVESVEDQPGIANLYAPKNSPLVSYLNNALKAKELFTRDRDYIVHNGEILTVDEFTGRVLADRRYNEGMHRAVEAKEGVEIKNENQTLTTVTLQNYFRLCDKLSGMTGTVETEATELHQIYELNVMAILPNRPKQREDLPDLVHKTQEAKFATAVEDIRERHEKGQPVLVGTTSVEKLEYLSKLLQHEGIPHSVLSAKHHEKKAEIVAVAGRLGGVTVATNMAGRGTDVVLGGNPDIVADLNLRSRGLDPVETPEEYEEVWDAEIERVRQQSKGEVDKVREAGGLYVLGTKRHESRRIDNQLRGRTGRQGDPSVTRFHLSMRNDLMVRFNGQRMEALMNTLNVPDDAPIGSKVVSNSIKSIQAQVESQNFGIRENVLKYDEVMNQQRKVIYAERRRVPEGGDLKIQVRNIQDDVVDTYVNGATADGYVEDWDSDELWNALEQLCSPTFTAQELVDGSDFSTPGDLSADELSKALHADISASYDQLGDAVSAIGGDDQMYNIERFTILNIMDQKWREHLYKMDYLKGGIGLRAMAQADPLVEYRREGYDMFTAMMDGIKEESARQLFLIHKQVMPTVENTEGQENQTPALPTEAAEQSQQMTYSDPNEGGSAEQQRMDQETEGSRAQRRKAARKRRR